MLSQHSYIASLEEAFMIAIAAKDYARQHIKKSNTQIEVNGLEQDSFMNINNGVKETRALVKENRIKLNSLEKNPGVIKYEETISVSSKYSLGNCGEFAAQALDYVLHQTDSDINAQVYYIRRGDHAILVLNLDMNSHPNIPETWGEAAVICDPWSDAVYKVSDYLSLLKSYYRVNNENKLQNFNSEKHLLFPDRFFGTNFLRENRTVDKLKENFMLTVSGLMQAMQDYFLLLKAEKTRLVNFYGEENKKALTLADKMITLKQAIRSTKELRQCISYCDLSNYDYRFAKKKLESVLKQIYENTDLAIQFSPQDKDVLFGYKEEGLKTEVMRFFKIKSDTQANMEDIADVINARLKKNV
jgi:hypothetical protein